MKFLALFLSINAMAGCLDPTDTETLLYNQCNMQCSIDHPPAEYIVGNYESLLIAAIKTEMANDCFRICNQEDAARRIKRCKKR